MSDEKLEVEEIELTEEEKLKLAEEEKLRLEEEKKKEEERLAKEKKEKEDKIQELIDSVDFEELETYKRWNRELEKEGEYQEPLVHRFFHYKQFPFCDHIEIKDEEDKVIEIKHLPWNKKTIIKFLKESLDVEKAQAFVDAVVGYKHNKKKGELENRLKGIEDFHNSVFGQEIKIINGEKHGVHHSEVIAKWDKDDLEDFEAKVLKLELAKKHLDDKEKKEKPIKDRQLEYSKIDGLLLEALVEKLEEGRPEKMDKYLELRKDIKHRHPIEED
jgi:aspartate beta-hydroxylase